MGVHLILSLTRAWVWQTGVLDRLDKISGCSVSGSGRRKQCNSPAYLIALDAITLCNINQCLESTGGVSMKGILDKRIGLPLAVSVKIPLSHRVHISPIQATKMNTSIFCRNTSQQINQVPGLKSWSPLMLVLLVLLQWLTGRVIKEVSFLGLSWTDFSPLGPVQFFSRGLWKANFEEPPFWWTGVGQVCTLCRIIFKELYKKILKLFLPCNLFCVFYWTLNRAFENQIILTLLWPSRNWSVKMVVGGTWLWLFNWVAHVTHTSPVLLVNSFIFFFHGIFLILSAGTGHRQKCWSCSLVFLSNWLDWVALPGRGVRCLFF